MTVIERIQREPAKLLAFATAILAVLTGTGVLTATGSTIALSVVAAAIGLLSYFVTPASEVVVQVRPDGSYVTKGGGGMLPEVDASMYADDATPLDEQGNA